MNMKLFGDIKVGRKYYEDRTTYHCKKCGHNYDVKMLGTNICPKDGSMMSYKKEWTQLWNDAFGTPLNY